MLYEYKTKSLAGDLVSGVIEADSTVAAQRQLRQQGQLLLSISPSHAGLFERSSLKLKRQSRVPKRELLMLTSQLAVMCETGVDLAEAIEESAQHCTHHELRKALLTVHSNLSQGQAISEALAGQSHVFDATYVASLAAGEASGQMAEVLTRMTDVLRSEIRLQSMLKTVMAYPLVLAALSTVVLGVLLFFVLPRFGEIFVDMKVPTPASTRMLLALSESLRSDTWIWLGAATCATVAVIQIWRSQRFRRQMDLLLLNGALIRGVTQSLSTGRAFRLLGTMLQSGVPLLEAIQLVRSSIKNSAFRELFNLLEVEVLNGRGIGIALASTTFVPGGAARMVLTAERTGRLGQVMEKVGSFYEDDGERRLQELSKYLEPAIIIGMGCLVGFVVTSIMLPMLSLSQITQ